MNRGSASGKLWLLTLILGAGLFLAGPIASGQDEEPVEAEAGSEEAATDDGDEVFEGDGLPELDDIDQILEGGDEILDGRGYSYDPGERRDPFKSLLAASEQLVFQGPRPDGIPGLLVDEVILSGIFKTRAGYVAQVQSSDRQKSYLIKRGDQLYDGDVVEITPDEVVFKQNVRDPAALKPFREVTKRLKP